MPVQAGLHPRCEQNWPSENWALCSRHHASRLRSQAHARGVRMARAASSSRANSGLGMKSNIGLDPIMGIDSYLSYLDTNSSMLYWIRLGL